jgi:ribosomal-protein-alanine N-acetyltransferase
MNSEYSFLVAEDHRSLTGEMVRDLSELDRLYFPTPWTIDSWAKLFIDHDRLLVVLNYQDSIIGFCLFDKSVEDSFAHLLKILIHPNYRMLGYSHKLFKMAQANLEIHGCSELFLEVEESNHAAQRLYIGEGFQIIYRKKDFYGADRSALIMTKANKSHS